MNRDTVYNIMTDQIIAALETGTVPWRKPFNGVNPRNMRNTEYRGINRLILGMQSRKSPFWLTFKQCRSLKGFVRKGERGTRIVFWKWVEKKDEDSDIESERREHYALLRYYTVFSIEQCAGIDADKLPEFPDVNLDLSPLEVCESLIDSIPGGKPDIRHHSADECFYSSFTDCIGIPDMQYFESIEGYYSSLFHEIGHWTGHKSRLDRDLGGSALDDKYHKEELIAELTAAFLCGRCGLDREPVTENAAAYIKGWIRKLRDDKKILIAAASAAQKACDFVTGESRDVPIPENDSEAASTSTVAQVAA